MLGWLWGFKTAAIFDVWTFEHIIAGLSIGKLVNINNKRHLKKHNQILNIFTKYRLDILFVLLLAFLWEAVEHYLEQGLLGNLVQYWFYGVEFWPNRLIADPLMLVVGYFIIQEYPKLKWPARIFSLFWLFFHIFVFPHSMYLHTLLS